MQTDAEGAGFLFIGHRGYAARYPENTLAGFKAAKQAKLKMVELDVRLSRDRRLMVIHDADLTRVAGLSRRVGELTCAQLQALDVGSWFDPAFSTEGVPALEAVFTLVADALRINVEIKADEYEAADPQDGIERQVLGLIHRFQARRTLISSFNPAVLRRIRRLSATQPVAVLSDAACQPDGLALCTEIGATAWNPHHLLVTAAGVAAAHAAGLKVYPFTVNAAADCDRLQRAGVDGVFTDDPGGLQRLCCSKTE
jgi:glycerophosphoryl diester phosphodiesterase